MKKLVSLFVALTFAFGLMGTSTANASPTVQTISSPVAAAVPAAAKKTTAKTTANLNLRKGAGTNHKSIRVIKKGTTVTKTGKTNGQWVQVKTSGKTGWVSSHYLTNTKPKTTKKKAPAKKPAAPKKTQKVTTAAKKKTAAKSKQTTTVAKKKAPTAKAPAKPQTRARLKAYVERTIAPYCPNSKVSIGNSVTSTYYFYKNEIVFGAGMMDRPLSAIKFVAMHECAHNLQDRAARGFAPANTAAARYFGQGLHGGSALETQAEIMAQIMSGVSAKNTGYYTKHNPSKTQLDNARATINQGQRNR